eukprot:350265-Chlamydomonas_euryale.AAC.1
MVSVRLCVGVPDYNRAAATNVLPQTATSVCMTCPCCMHAGQFGLPCTPVPHHTPHGHEAAEA